ncbi:MAG: APC family permease [Saprospiraceae bacterium]|nr:APC family permease [Saprospiraceae bacterium]
MIILIGAYFMPSVTHKITLDLSNNVPPNLFQSMLIAFVGVFWSMGGWHHATYLSGEVIDPQKTVPKAMLFGTLTVTVFYLFIIAAYMILLPAELMSSSERVAGDAVAMVFSWGGKFVSIAIAISIFGTIGIYTMSAPRIYYAMAKDGIFFDFLSDISDRFKTPYKAMLFQAFWASILILLWGSFIRIITFVTFMDITFMALATATIFIFRNQKSDHSGFRLKWYPLIPLVYLIITIAFVLNTLANLNMESWAGVGILCMGIPSFYYFQRHKKRAAKST